MLADGSEEGLEPVLGADPAVLDAYAADAAATISLVVPAATTYGRAWAALVSAPATPSIGAPASSAGALRDALAELTTVSRSVEGYADALRAAAPEARAEILEPVPLK